MSPVIERPLTIHVHGVPQTQGSMKGYAIGGRVRVTANNGSKLKPWREAIRSTAVSQLADDWQPYAGPLEVRIAFALPRPSSAPKTKRTWPLGARSGDLDKLSRAVLDALTDAGVWRDDAQVVELHAVKDYPGPEVGQNVPGAIITIRRRA